MKSSVSAKTTSHGRKQDFPNVRDPVKVEYEAQLCGVPAAALIIHHPPTVL